VTIKPLINQSGFPQFFSVLKIEKETKLFIGEKFIFYFKTEKKLGKTRLVIWWFGVTNKIQNNI